METIAVVAEQDITRLDRYSDLRSVIERATHPDADLEALGDQITTISASPPIYPEWVKGLGIVLFTIGFSVNVQATWQEVWVAALTSSLVALLVLVGDRVGRVSVLTPFLAAVVVSVTVLSIVDPADSVGGGILLMVPALFFFIPGDILSASMLELAAGRITTGSAQFVNAIFSLLLLYVGIVFGALLTGTDGSSLFQARGRGRIPRRRPVAGMGVVRVRLHARVLRQDEGVRLGVAGHASGLRSSTGRHRAVRRGDRHLPGRSGDDRGRHPHRA